MVTSKPAGWNNSIIGLILTFVGLVTLLVIPISVGIRLRHDYDQIDRLEDAREHINQTLLLALEAKDFIMRRYMLEDDKAPITPLDVRYSDLMQRWKQESAYKIPPVLQPTSIASDWNAGKEEMRRWIVEYLSRFDSNGDFGGDTKTFIQYNTMYDRGIMRLNRARLEAEAAQTEIRLRQAWLHGAQTTVVTPLAIICLAVAYFAWFNVRNLQQAWASEKEIAQRLEVAVKESNHRIKNNLQVIGALIDMQMQDPGDTVPKSSLEDIVHQVRAVAAVHDFFSHELRSDYIEGDQMLRKLVSLTASPIGLRVELESEAVALAVKQATAVALITNELLLNCGKHGATEAHVRMKSDGKTASLQVHDNGPGFPEPFDVNQNSNLGLSLVDTLARHDLAGALTVFNRGGACVEITFPLALAEATGK